MMNRLLRQRSPARRDLPLVAKDERIYAIGDVHGRHDLLIRLLARIHEDAASQDDGRKVRLVFLGDYIDRGDDSAAVLSTLNQLRAAPPTAPARSGIDFLLGNHEAALLRFLDDPVAGRAWLGFGAPQTLASYDIAPAPLEPEPAELRALHNALLRAMGPHLDFLRSMAPTARSGDVLFTHAGLNPAAGAVETDVEAMLWGHPEFLCDQPVRGVRVVHGHYDAPRPVSLPGRICVDTGAYYSGTLTAVRLDAGERFISVE